MCDKCKPVPVSPEVLDFLTKIHGDREDKEQRKEDIFNQAFKQAYRDMSTHTVAYTDDAKKKYVQNDSTRCNGNKEKIREGIKEYIFNSDDVSLSALKSINTKKGFDKWHKEACEKLNKIGDLQITGLQKKDDEEGYPGDTMEISKLLRHTDNKIEAVFTYGQAQKLINMMVKYLYIYYQCEGWKDLKDLKKYAHVPIDSYVLTKIDADKRTPWSKIISYDDAGDSDAYVEYKKAIDKKANEEGYKSAFMWELANWPFKSVIEESADEGTK